MNDIEAVILLIVFTLFLIPVTLISVDFSVWILGFGFFLCSVQWWHRQKTRGY